MKTARFAAYACLIFLAVTSIAGAIPMILNPDGEPVGMPQSLLEHSPFHSYLIPGIVLLMANGLLSLWTLGCLLREASGYPLWVAAQGGVLMGWLIVEITILRTVVWAHYVYLGVALMLIASGLRLREPAAMLGEVPEDFVI